MKNKSVHAAVSELKDFRCYELLEGDKLFDLGGGSYNGNENWNIITIERGEKIVMSSLQREWGYLSLRI